MAGVGADVFGKGVDLLREMVPTARQFAVLANAIDPFAPAFLRLLQLNAHAVGVQLHDVKVRPSDDLRRVFAEFARSRVDGLIVQPSLLSPAIAELALQHRLPSIAGFRAFAETGGLMSYSAKQAEIFEQAARYVDLILKGAAPADLPAAHATTFELVINLRTAKALGIVVPLALLIRADELIE